MLWRLSSPQCGKKEPQCLIHPMLKPIYLSSNRLRNLLRGNFTLFIIGIAGFEEVVRMVLILKPPMALIAVHPLVAPAELQRLDDFILIP